MKVICHKHHEIQGISEILRLFYTDLVQQGPGELSVEDVGPLNLPGTFYSELDREVTREEMRDQDDQSQVLVSSRLEGTDLKMEEKVIPSAIRRELKRQAYGILSQALDVHYPWGSLTGVRPGQVAYRSYLELGCDFAKAKKDLVENWYLAPDKADLALETALAEEDILQKCDSNLPMLYIGIPFCRTRCAYCSFITKDATAKSARLDLYVAALISEIRELADFFVSQGKSFQAIYVGGGTPTALPEDLFCQLMEVIDREIQRIDGAEITVEAGRPDSISKGKLEAIRSLGQVRLCINPQTMFDRTLELIGRDHTVADVYRSYHDARSLGFDSINMDLILGLPGESGEDFLCSLDKLLELGPESITLHTMAMKKSAFLEQKYREKFSKLRFPDQAMSVAFSRAVKELKNRGYKPYYLYRQKNVRGGLENIGFALPGHFSTYNVGMMSDRISVLGLGSGSSSKLVQGTRLDRLCNPKDLKTYCERISDISQKKQDFFQTHSI